MGPIRYLLHLPLSFFVHPILFHPVDTSKFDLNTFLCFSIFTNLEFSKPTKNNNNFYIIFRIFYIKIITFYI